MSPSKRKATPLTLEKFRELAMEFPKLLIQVRRRVNPGSSRSWDVEEFLGDAPGPAFFEAVPTFPFRFGASGASPTETGFLKASGMNRRIYLDPLVGVLLRNAGYLDYSVRARSLYRVVADIDVEAKKHLVEHLPDLGRAEAESLAADARREARHSILGATATLSGRLDRLGKVADLGTVGPLSAALAKLARELADVSTGNDDED